MKHRQFETQETQFCFLSEEWSRKSHYILFLEFIKSSKWKGFGLGCIQPPTPTPPHATSLQFFFNYNGSAKHKLQAPWATSVTIHITKLFEFSSLRDKYSKLFLEQLGVIHQRIIYQLSGKSRLANKERKLWLQLWLLEGDSLFIPFFFLYAFFFLFSWNLLCISHWALGFGDYRHEIHLTFHLFLNIFFVIAICFFICEWKIVISRGSFPLWISPYDKGNCKRFLHQWMNKL